MGLPAFVVEPDVQVVAVERFGAFPAFHPAPERQVRKAGADLGNVALAVQLESLVGPHKPFRPLAALHIGRRDVRGRHGVCRQHLLDVQKRLLRVAPPPHVVKRRPVGHPQVRLLLVLGESLGQRQIRQPQASRGPQRGADQVENFRVFRVVVQGCIAEPERGREVQTLDGIVDRPNFMHVSFRLSSEAGIRG